ncbi:alpha-2-macroglobulin-like isoform X1 [Amia ocellicauda]|uniref:alpha-2-macroglobulin-like isoform X1 n=2 Tax=Amia ocellicauda TaxID=2972642 RepID=UPI00346399FC
MWKWLLLGCVLLCQADETPVYIVTFPAVISGGSQAKLCGSLLHANETLHLSVSLISEQEKRTLLDTSTEAMFTGCVYFQAPLVEEDTKGNIEVEMRGDTFSHKQRSLVMFRKTKKLMIIQTDKPIYKPGQKVRFRIVSLSEDFAPILASYSTVEIRDPENNRIAQWLNQTSDRSILDLSHQLNSEAKLGRYSLTVWNSDGLRDEIQFTVKEYVLPKFEVTVTGPSMVTVLDTEAKVQVCARYTYGKPVSGRVQIELCPISRQRYLRERNCLSVSTEVDKTGCVSHMFNITLFKDIPIDHLEFKAEVQEDNTGVSMSKTTSLTYTRTTGKVSFVDTPKFYQKGDVFEGKVKAEGADSLPLVNEMVYVLDSTSRPFKILLNVTTDSNGIAHFSLNTSDWTSETISLRASFQKVERSRWGSPHGPHYKSETHTVSQVQKPHGSYLSIEGTDTSLPCGEEALISINYAVTEVDIQTDKISLDLFILILAKGAISLYEHMKVDLPKHSLKLGRVPFRLPVDYTLAPIAQMLVYTVLPGEKVIADSFNFQVEKCLPSEVSLKFSSPEALPGGQSAVTLSSQPGSLCSLKAIDQSVLLLDRKNELTIDSIYKLLPVQKGEEVPYSLEDPRSCVLVRHRRSYFSNRENQPKDAYTIFKELGLKIVSNTWVREPECLIFRGREYYHMTNRHRLINVDYRGISPVMMSRGGSGRRPKETIRTFFPETWIWDLIPVGASGSVELPVTVPDTITTWEASAFCLAPTGLGLAPPALLTAFQPFFVELTLPYSVIRGEQFEMRATVFNYLSKCIMVKVTPAKSSDYTLEPCKGCEYTSCLCASEAKTFHWTLVPSALGSVNISVSAEAIHTETICDNELVTVPEQGHIDTVIRPLLVEPEGMQKIISYNWLLCPKGTVEKEEVQLQLPEVIVEGSARASISVLGDLLGRALQNLDSLLVMPYGCGEQNMVRFAPNIYILKYLESTGQLTQAIKSKASEYLTSGYQRELNYKHDDGSYSAFGNSDSSGNTWLTAFVMKSFGGAQSYIYIDSSNIQSAKAWLEARQENNGCFQSVGKLFNNRMKGGVSDEVTLTAYIAAAMLELNTSVSEPVLNSSLSCLRAAVHNLTNTYAATLLAYTFTLAGEEDTRASLLAKLDVLDTTEADSLSVEMNSYTLLALLSHQPLSSSDLGRASRIVSWLIKQQNPYGGFSSTQDTVVALQALSLYGAVAFNKESSSTVTVRSTGGEHHHFTLDQSNSLLYQEKELQDLLGVYSVEAEGTGCASIQIALHYNIPPPADFVNFNLTLKAYQQCNTSSENRDLSLLASLMYAGPRDNTNMVILNFKLLSGFILKDTQIRIFQYSRLTLVPLTLPLISQDRVKRIDKEDGHVILYLDELTRGKTYHYHITMTQKHPVNNLKPAVVKVYDYYQTSEQAVSEYTSPCPDDRGEDINEV